MNTYEIVLQIPQINLSAVASAYVDVAAFLFTVAALTYICFRTIAPYIKNEKEDDSLNVLAKSVFLVILGIIPVAFANHIAQVMNVALMDKERIKEMLEIEEAYNDYFEVEEDA